MKNNFKKVLNKYSLLKNSFLKDLRLRKQKVKSIWSKANTLKNNKLKKNKNLDKFQNFFRKLIFQNIVYLINSKLYLLKIFLTKKIKLMGKENR
tara:strand:+ start:97 stop:378 length:282 start_codon:yes stop_codon:yes gene_type:complete